MSRNRYFSVMCDNCQLEDNFYPSMADAIAEKRELGWTRHRDRTDHCPDCEPKVHAALPFKKVEPTP